MNTPKTITVTEKISLLDKLIVSSGTTKQWAKGLRNYSMAMVMLETGLRVQELVQLRISDLWYIDLPVDNLVVRKDIAKNKCERIIPISTGLNKCITELKKGYWERFNAVPEDYAFFTRDAKFRLTTRQVERIIKQAAHEAFNREVTPHMLRHTFASRLMKSVNSRTVQALLGHANLQSTQVYMHPDLEDLSRAIDCLE